MAFTHRADGSILVASPEPMGTYPTRLTERLEHWAAAAPEGVFLTQREGNRWRHVTYREALRRVCRIGQALLQRSLSAERPVLILSGNDIEHALLGLACLHVGIPYAPVSVPYSTVLTDFARLRHIVELLTPGLVFAADGGAFGPAIAAVMPGEVEVVLTVGAIDRSTT